ncbi:MAG: hypothetical protein AVDCRST_MAG02-747 [uncultured Rubrobacteraceae bacterium]|uniref:Uncharacterized protein n=1 Tax=uncultured Rubrobacteraceae bacterium TaxID=349277 RepID=A0A6J4QXD3_9ACTN|nr:MAG: hypothetical protein AVDCRST_MAG02-747 [uncultured Rubrobacteraceae bacterium]
MGRLRGNHETSPYLEALSGLLEALSGLGTWQPDGQPEA